MGYKPVHHEVIVDHNVTEVHYVPVKKTVEVPETEYRTYTTEVPVTAEVPEEHEVTTVHYSTVKKEVPYKYDTYKTVWHNKTVQEPIQTVRPVYTHHQVVQQPQYEQQAAPVVYSNFTEQAPVFQQPIEQAPEVFD